MHFRPWFSFFGHPPPPWQDEGGGGKGVGKKHLLASLEMTWNLLTPSDQLTPKIQKKFIRILFFFTLTLGWKNKKRPSGPTELDLEAGNLVSTKKYLISDGDKWKLPNCQFGVCPRRPGSRADLARVTEQLRQTRPSELRARGGEPHAGDCYHQEWDLVSKLHGGNGAYRRQCSGCSTQISNICQRSFQILTNDS